MQCRIHRTVQNYEMQYQVFNTMHNLLLGVLY